MDDIENEKVVVAEDNEQSSDEEDGGLDWTKLTRPVIPKRGEKEFEPRAQGGSNLQLHFLDQSRNAMFDALRTTRTTSSKAISYATWHPSLARAHVTQARGIHFSTMGHSVPRIITTPGDEKSEKVSKRLELLPEEAIYLIERGSLFCWKETDLDLTNLPGINNIAGSPMSVQQAYSEMIGTEDLTLEKFHVFAYLKRLGYVVTRTNPPTSFYPSPTTSRKPPPSSIQHRILSLFSLWTSWLSRVLTPRFNWWKPVCFSHFNKIQTYTSLFHSMRFLASGHRTALSSPRPTEVESQRQATPYKIFYNLYKPSTPFKKSAPPPPDFQIVVIDARTTPMPTLQELTDLFDVLPELPPPVPRQRRSPIGGPVKPAENPLPTPQTTISTSFIRRLLHSLFQNRKQQTNTAHPPNPFMALKAGKKMVVIAVVDAGNISFYKFSQGAFEEWPMA